MILAAGVVALSLIPGAAARGIKVVAPFALDRYARTGELGLLVPGEGASVSRAEALSKLPSRPSADSLWAHQTVYVSLPPPGRSHNIRRYPVAIVGTGVRRGVITSSSTRIPGLLAAEDLRKQVEAGKGPGGPLGVKVDAHPAKTLQRLDRRLTNAHNSRDWATVVLVAATLAPLGVALVRRSPAWARVGLLAIPAALSSALAISAFGGGRPASTVPLLALLAVAGSAAAASLPLRRVLLVFLAAYLVTLAKWPVVNSLAIIGPHPDGGGRFYGITNEVETLLLAPLLAAATTAFTPAAALGIILVDWSKAGADGGGLIVFLVALIVLVLRRVRLELTMPRLAMVGAAAIAIGLAVVGLDALLGGSSHVTGTVGSGPHTLAGELAHRLRVSWDGATNSVGAVAKVVFGAAALAALARMRPRAPTVDALLVAIVVSLAVNDTPTDVLSFGALAGATLWVWEQTRRIDSPPMSRRPLFAAVSVLALALGVAGCGSGTTVSPTPETVIGSVPKGPTLVAKRGDPTVGKAIFASKGCGSCHTLKAAGSSGTIGPNLDQKKPSLALAVTRVTNGKSPMPSFKGQLSPKQISDVATFVFDSTHGG